MDKGRRVEMLDRFERATDLPLLILALAIIPLLVVPLVVDVSDGVDTAFFAADWVIWAVFAADLAVRTYLSERRVRYLVGHWFDVLIVVLPFLRPLRVSGQCEPYGWPGSALSLCGRDIAPTGFCNGAACNTSSWPDWLPCSVLLLPCTC